MITNYFKVAVRQLLRHKGYSFLSIAGLPIGLACGLIVTLYVIRELSFDQYHLNKDRIFRLATRVDGSSYGAIAKVNGPWGTAAKDAIPEIDEVVRFVFHSSSRVVFGEKQFTEPDGMYADPQVFNVFSWKLLAGDPRGALREPNSVVITRDMAEKYFGGEDPVGKVLVFDMTQPRKVTGVMENVPSNSHFGFTFLTSMSTLAHPDRDNWIRWNQFYTYFLLKSPDDVKAVESKMPAVLAAHMGALAQPYKPFLQAITSIHLHSNLFREMEPNSSVSTIVLMGMIGLFLLLIGCMNFVNLATARSMTRAKEVGIRKVAGADRRMLARQFIGESLLLTIFASLIALTLIEVALPLFNQMAATRLSLGEAGWEFYGAALLLVLMVGIGAGSYPALLLSSFGPAEVLKGGWKTAARGGLRKVLVVFQFAVSAFFLVSTGIVRDQLGFIQKKNPGFNQEQLVSIRLRNGTLSAKSEMIKSELLKSSSVVSVSASAGQPNGNDYGIPTQIEGIANEQVPPMRVLAVDQDFIQTFQMEMAQGRQFSRQLATDTLAYIINEEAARALGKKDPLGTRIAMSGVGRPYAPIIGVVKDFHFRSFHEKIGPILMFVPPTTWLSFLNVRLKSGRVEEGLRWIRDRWSIIDPGSPLEYSFFDEQFARLHEADRRTEEILSFFSWLAISIACLGLVGLAAFSAQQRTKEIGVRKVLGASVLRIVGLLAKEFLVLVVVANVIAWPVVYIVMSKWLETFAYHPELSPSTFMLASLVGLAIAFLAVCYQSVKAALMDPVKALRYE